MNGREAFSKIAGGVVERFVQNGFFVFWRGLVRECIGFAFGEDLGLRIIGESESSCDVDEAGDEASEADQLGDIFGA